MVLYPKFRYMVCIFYACIRPTPGHPGLEMMENFICAGLIGGRENSANLNNWEGVEAYFD